MPIKYAIANRGKRHEVKACTSIKTDDSIQSQFVFRCLTEKLFIHIRQSDDDRPKGSGESKIPASWHVCAFPPWAVSANSVC